MVLLRFSCIYIFGDGFGVEPIIDNTLCDIACLDPIYYLVTDERENVDLRTIAARMRIVKIGRTLTFQNHETSSSPETLLKYPDFKYINALSKGHSLPSQTSETTFSTKSLLKGPDIHLYKSFNEAQNWPL